MAASVYISDKAVVDLVPYAARRTVFRLDVGPFVLLYLGVYLGIWNLDPKDGWGQVVVLVLLPGVLACHLLVFLSTQWSIRFMCLVSQRRVASIDLAEVCCRYMGQQCSGTFRLAGSRKHSLYTAVPVAAGSGVLVVAEVRPDKTHEQQQFLQCCVRVLTVCTSLPPLSVQSRKS